MVRQKSMFGGGEWFELYLTTGEAGVGTFCGLLRRNGHDPYRGRNGQGRDTGPRGVTARFRLRWR